MGREWEIQYQIDSAEQIYKDLFEREAAHYLLADEVGLGKTITAAKVVKKLLEEKEEKGKNNAPIRIGYICANLALAKHNQDKLFKGIFGDSNGEVQYKSAGRLSLAFKTILDNAVNCKSSTKLIIDTITPVTSLKVLSSGTLEERCCAYALAFPESEAYYVKRACKGKSKKNDNEIDAKIDGERNELKALSQNGKKYTEFCEAFKKVRENEENETKDAAIEACVEAMRKVIRLKSEKELDAWLYLACLSEDGIPVGRKTKTIVWNRTGDKECDSVLEAYEKVNSCDIRRDKEKKKEFCTWVADELNNHKKGAVYNEIKNKVNSCKTWGNGRCVNIKNWIVDYLEYEEKLLWLGAILNYWINNDVKLHDWEKEKLEDCLGKCKENCKVKLGDEPVIDSIIKEKSENVESDQEKYKTLVEVIQDVFGNNIGLWVLKLARKAMAVAGLKLFNVDLFIADEIQNYSELFALEKNDAKTETELVVKEVLFNEDKKVLMLSATPFRYRTKLNELENKDIDAECDRLLDDEEEGLSKEERYLQKSTDIYQEFLKIIKYLNKDFCEKDWEQLCKDKYEAVKKGEENNVKEIVTKQNEMLRNSHVSRIERYMAGIECDFAPDDTVLEWNEIGFEDLLCVPRKVVAVIDKNMLGAAVRKEDQSERPLLLLDENSEMYVALNHGYYSPDDESTDCFVEALQSVGYEEENISEAVYQISLEEISSEDDNIYDWYYLTKIEGKSVLERFKKWKEKNSVRMDYLKSTPACLSFKQGYSELAGFSDQSGKCMISGDKVKEFTDLQIESARIKKLFRKVFDEEESHKLLFVPPIMTESLCGVFKGKKGFSKRLFFSDYNMTPKSLSVLLTYEANRRVCEDIKKQALKETLPAAPDNGERKKYYILTSELLKYYNDGSYIISKENDTQKKESQGTLVKIIKDYDKSVYEGKTVLRPDKAELYQKASPYYYAKEKAKLKEDEIISFCDTYYKLMTGEEALRVLLAYSQGESLFERILAYGKDGNIYGVFDEYREMEEKFTERFSELGVTNYRDIQAETDKGSKKMKVGYAIGHYAGDTLLDENAAKTLGKKINAFNSPFRPFHFISTSIGQEGFDFHKYCKTVVHWSLVFNPVKFEQREGRIDRPRSYANRLNAYEKYKENVESPSVEKWDDVYSVLKETDQELVKSSRGLYPEFVMSSGDLYKMKRETYYYADSYEQRMLPQVLHGVGYYRSLLGQSGDESLEDAMLEFLKDKSGKKEYFLDLSPATFDGNVLSNQTRKEFDNSDYINGKSTGETSDTATE